MTRWRRCCFVIFILAGFCPTVWGTDIVALESEKADLRALMEQASKEQQLLERSGILYRNPELEAYLKSVAVRLDTDAASPGGEFRIKMIKDPRLNAFTYPDGTCYIQTGILARLENEGQLAALLAHELAHYLNDHAVNGIRRLHRLSDSDRSNFSADGDGSTTRIQIRRRSEYAWSDYHHLAEFEADREALKMMVHAGYDPHEAIKLFGHLVEEMTRENLREPFALGSHPRLKERVDKCKDYLKTLNPKPLSATFVEGAFEERMQDLTLENIGLDIQAGRFEQALEASEKYLSKRPEDAKGHYLLGEIYRQMDDPGGKRGSKAESCYKRAITLDEDYADPYRALGLLYYKTGHGRQAKSYLEASLALAPRAPENAYVLHYLSRIQP